MCDRKRFEGSGTIGPLARRVSARVAHAVGYTSSKLLAKVLNTGLLFHWINRGDRFWRPSENSAQFACDRRPPFAAI